MSRAVARRAGETVKILDRPLPFSIYPVARTTRRFGLHSRIFASSPWAVMNQVVENSLTGDPQDQARAFLSQAQNFYEIAQASHLSPTKPLLFYYSFLNVAKALALVKGVETGYEKAVHGLSERTPAGQKEFLDSEVIVQWRQNNPSPRIYNDFKRALGGRIHQNGRKYLLKNVMAQLLPGHRVWCKATGQRERFIEIHNIEFRYDPHKKRTWLEINLFLDDLTRFGITRKALLSESGLSDSFREVVSNESVDGRKIIKLEQSSTLSYRDRHTDKIPELVKVLKPFLWAAALSAPPYRKNYLYLCPSAEKEDMLPQLASIYVAFFYLGSVTRYRPHKFASILNGSHGSHLQEVILNIPQQFLYLTASEFLGREVAKAPLV